MKAWKQGTQKASKCLSRLSVHSMYALWKCLIIWTCLFFWIPAVHMLLRMESACLDIQNTIFIFITQYSAPFYCVSLKPSSIQMY